MGGKGTTVSQREPTAEERALMQAGIPAAEAFGKLSEGLFKQFGSQYASGDGLYNPNALSLASTINSGFNDINRTASDLSQGKVSQSMLDNQSKAMQYQYNNSFGSTLNNAAQNGVINSSVMNKNLSNLNNSFAAAAANNYNNNLTTQSNLLGQQANLFSNQLNQQNALQGLSYGKLDKMYGYASGNYAPTVGAAASVTQSASQPIVTQNGGGFSSGLFSGLGRGIFK